MIELDFKRVKTTSLQTWCSFLFFRDVAVWFLRRQSLGRKPLIWVIQLKTMKHRYLLGGVSNSTEKSELQNQFVKSVLKGWTESWHLYSIFTSSPSSYQYQVLDLPDLSSCKCILNFHALCLETLASFPFNKMQKSGISYFTHIFPLTLTHAVVSSMTRSKRQDMIFMAIFQAEFLLGLLNLYLAPSSGAVVTVLGRASP